MAVETSRLYPSRTLVIPNNSYADLYGIFYDLNSGDMFNATTGAVETTWASAAVVAALHTNNKSVWLLTTPPIGVDINVGLNLFQNASPANTDAITKSGKYDPRLNHTYSDATPASQGKTFTRK
jgi:hypothetical protein